MGFTVSRHPTYIYQTPSGYIFRLRIPCDLKILIGKSEFRYSLHTGALRVARHRARYIASYIHQLFLDVRNDVLKVSPELIIRKIQQ